MLIGAFSNIKIKINFKPKVDNIVFSLHYRYTYVLFMASVLLTTLYDWVGNKIECMIDTDSDPLKDMVDSWCFIMGTFTVDKHRTAEVGKEVPFPGVGPYTDKDEITVHSYYQWVPFVLFFQGVVFYFPHWLWKRFDAGMFRNIIMDLSIKDYLGNNLATYENRRERFAKLAKYVKEHLNTHKFWAYKFFFCEFLNLFVAAMIFVLTNWFLGGQFTSYGVEVIKFLNMDPENRTDPMYLIFPRMAKCTFQKFGPSGTPELLDVMCLIPTNIVNEKIYVFIWMWLVVLMFITSAWLLFRIFTILVPSLRYQLLKVLAPRALPNEVRIVMECANLSDWFLILNLGKNMENTIFSEFIGFLSKELMKEQEESETLPLTVRSELS